VFDVRIAQRIAGRVSATAQIQNLSGAEYHTFGVLGDPELLGAGLDDDPRFYSPGAPRAAWIGIEVRF
jgi:hypothetical protein